MATLTLVVVPDVVQLLASMISLLLVVETKDMFWMVLINVDVLLKTILVVPAGIVKLVGVMILTMVVEEERRVRVIVWTW